MAISDQVQVAGFVVLALAGFFTIIGFLVCMWAVVDWYIRKVEARDDKRARLAGHDRRRQERLAASNGKPLASGVVTNHGRHIYDDERAA